MACRRPASQHDGRVLKKRASEQSRWGTELLGHTGKDDEIFGFSATAPNIAGDEWLRHIGLANVSYLAPAGKGLTVQGGIFASLIGYDSLYAKDNFNYTRPWGADFTPYLMLGVNAAYPFTDKLTGTFYVVNGYWHLANANSVPSTGVQLAYKATPKVTVKETILWGPHQSNTSLEFWRFLSDTIIERRTDRVVVALNSHFATERVDSSGRPRAWWVAAQVPMRWTVRGPWSVAVRPEIAWDSDGRWTLAEQTVKAVTSTVRVPRPLQVGQCARSSGTPLRRLARAWRRVFQRRRDQCGRDWPQADAASPDLRPDHHLRFAVSTLKVRLTCYSSE